MPFQTPSQREARRRAFSALLRVRRGKPNATPDELLAAIASGSDVVVQRIPIGKRTLAAFKTPERPTIGDRRKR